MQENCICVRNVAKSFNGRKVVNDLSFEVIDAYLLDETASLSTPVLIKTLPACKVAASEKIIDSYDDLFQVMPEMGAEKERLGWKSQEH
ncbi:MAG: hypothetical protein MSA09_07795 [Lachnospiraceae bacterium]|nr:hypothetical protein [Lachnospiraceae bacterium]MDD7177821.1 hypothetical protein [bacterium]MDY5516824.1 hypothetical protein [Lachnospiraceae bacterium]